MSRLQIRSSAVMGLVLAAATLSAAAPQSTDVAADTQAVLAANAEWGQNFVACDLDRMKRLLADDLVLIQMTGTISTKADFLNIVKGCGMESARSEAVSARVFGNTAVVIGTLHFKMKAQATGGAQTYSRFFVKQNGGWRMVSDSHTPVAAPRPAAAAPRSN